jgi:hypothetical protein
VRHDARDGGQTPVVPLLLVAVGALALVAGVAVPVRAMAGGPADLVAAGVSLADPPVLVGLGLVTGGVVSLALGTLLLALDPALY